MNILKEILNEELYPVEWCNKFKDRKHFKVRAMWEYNNKTYITTDIYTAIEWNEIKERGYK